MSGLCNTNSIIESTAANALDLIDTGEIKLYVSESILDEDRKVLNRAEVHPAPLQITDVLLKRRLVRLLILFPR